LKLNLNAKGLLGSEHTHYEKNHHLADGGVHHAGADRVESQL
jgi:hypothetical protein